MKSLCKLLLIAAVLAAFGCQTSNQTTLAVETCSGGYLGNSDPAKPLVCVSTSGTSATPKIDPVHVYAKGKNGVATQITWASGDRNADLHVTMANPSQNCVKSVACPKKSACFATIVENAPAGAQCEYQISNGAGKAADPIIIIDTCCPEQ